MKKAFLSLFFVLSLFGFSSETFAQEKTVNPMEIDAKHNLEVSRQYFKLKKAYIAVKKRLNETVVAYPEFSQMDEVLYLLGMSNYYLSENKGKQQIDTSKMSEDEKLSYTPENLRSEAVMHLTELTKNYPKSKFKKNAEKTLKLLQAKK